MRKLIQGQYYQNYKYVGEKIYEKKYISFINHINVL